VALDGDLLEVAHIVENIGQVVSVEKVIGLEHEVLLHPQMFARRKIICNIFLIITIIKSKKRIGGRGKEMEGTICLKGTAMFEMVRIVFGEIALINLANKQTLYYYLLL